MQEQIPTGLDIQSFDIILFIQKRFRTIVKITVAGAILSVIAAFLITPEYKATAVLFATAAQSRADVITGYKPDLNLLTFGTEDNLDQMIQVLNSNYIRDRIIEQYYAKGKKQLSPDERIEYIQDYTSNVSTKRTEYLGVEITVMDKTPQTAADIANTICALYDSVILNIQNQRARQAFEVCSKQLEKYRKKENYWNDSLEVIRKLGMSDYKNQAGQFARYLARAIEKGNTRGAIALEAEMRNLGHLGNLYEVVNNELWKAREQIQYYEKRVVEAETDLNNQIPNKFVVDYAEKPLKKAKPVRWLVVLASTVSTFIFTVLLLAVFDSLKGAFKPKNS